MVKDILKKAGFTNGKDLQEIMFRLNIMSREWCIGAQIDYFTQRCWHTHLPNAGGRLLSLLRELERMKEFNEKVREEEENREDSDDLNDEPDYTKSNYNKLTDTQKKEQAISEAKDADIHVEEGLDLTKKRAASSSFNSKVKMLGPLAPQAEAQVNMRRGPFAK